MSGIILRLPLGQLPRCTLFSQGRSWLEDGSRRPVDDMEKSAEAGTSGSAREDAVRLPGWGSRECPKAIVRGSRLYGSVGFLALKSVPLVVQLLISQSIYRHSRFVFC